VCYVPSERSPLKDLVPIKSVVGPSQDKGRSREQAEMEEGAIEKAQSPSLTVSEYKGAFHNRDSAFVYNWIDDESGDRHSPIDVKEMEWLTDQSYFYVNDKESTE
jgi:hypothetical protein